MTTKTSIRRPKTASPRGASRKLAKTLRNRLTSGEFRPGDRLPTDRKLMEQFHVGYSVANRAMDILAREGLVQRRQGQGSFVSEKAPETRRATPSDTFAIVLTSPRWGFNLTLCQGSEALAGRLHYRTIACDTENNVDRQAAVLLQLIADRVAGIALVPTTRPETPEWHVRACQESGIPVVLLHRNVRGASAPLIALPFEEIGCRAGKALVERGHRRVACVFDERYEATERYEAGLRRGLEQCKHGAYDLSIHCSDKLSFSTMPEYRDFLEKTLTDIFHMPRQRRPTAIFAIAEDDAEWIYMRLMKLGVRVPEEMSLITFGGSSRRHVVAQQLTAVAIDETAVGQLAARLLSEMADSQRPIKNCEQFTAAVDFHAGQTLGPAPTAIHSVKS
jgi:GntR family transcriptional regulator, arabinose operon transcriptional repressor